MDNKLTKLIPFGLAIMLVLAHLIQILNPANNLNKYGVEVSYSIIDSVLYVSIGLIITLF